MGLSGVLRGLIKPPDEPPADELTPDGYLFDSERDEDDEEMTWLKRWQDYSRWWDGRLSAGQTPPER